MKILELNFTKGWRGGERQTLFQLLGFREMGYQVAVVCRKGSPLEKKSLEESIPTFSFKNVFGVVGFLMFRSWGFDLIHAQTAHILTYCILTKPVHRKKVVFSRRIDFVPKGKLTRLKYRSANLIVGVSQEVKFIVEKFTERRALCISDMVQPKILNEERIAAYRTDFNIPSGTKIIGTMAALVHHKDPVTLIHAIYLLKKKRTDFIFLHFGAGALEEPCKQLISELELTDHFFLAGFQEDVEDFFLLLDLFIMSSQNEGLGSSVLDAFLYKVPAITTRVGGLVDIMEDDRGLMCPAQDPQALADQMDFAMDHRDVMLEKAERAFNYVKKFHSIDYISHQYAEAMRKLI